MPELRTNIYYSHPIEFPPHDYNIDTFFGIMPGLDFGFVTPLTFFGIMPALDLGLMTIELFSELYCRPP